MNFGGDSVPGPASRSAMRVLAGILGLAVVARLLALGNWVRTPLFVVPTGDEAYFHRAALELAGGGSAAGAHFYQPLYCAFLALLYTLFGATPAAVRPVQVALGLATVLLFHQLGREVGSRATGWIAAGIAALYGPAIVFELQLLSPALALALTTLALWLLLRAARRGEPWLLLPAGLALGCGLLARPNLAVVLPAALAIWLRAETDRRRAGIGAALLAAGLAASILPFWLHNARAGAASALVSTSAGANFFLGNNERASGSFHVPRGTGIDAETHESFEGSLASVATRAAGRPLSPSEVSRYWMGRGLSYWREQPLAALRLYLHKLRLGLGRNEIANHYGYAAVAELVPVLRWLPGFGLVLPFAAVGLALGWAEPRVRLLGIWTALYLAGMALFFVADGYRLLMLPALIPLAALGMEGSVGAIRSRSRGRAKRAAVAFVAAAAICWPATVGAAALRSESASLWNAVGRSEVQRGRLDRAEAAFRRSISSGGNSGAGPARANLAAMLAQRGDLEGARRSYREAIGVYPELRPAYVALARLEERAGRREEALRIWRALAQISADPAVARSEIERLERAAAEAESAPAE